MTVNLGETPEEKKIIDELWHNIWVSRLSLDAMQKCLTRGEYSKFLEFTATMAMGWEVVGDAIFEKLLTQRERDELVSKVAQSDLEALALRYMRELHDGTT